MARMTGSRFIAETFKGYGVSHVFLMQGIMIKALAEMAKIGVRPVITHSEKADAYMADGYSRASHKPGICMSQSVGAANLASGLQDAYLGSSPVIAISGRRKAAQRYRNAYQEIEHKSLFEDVTKFNVQVDSLEQFPMLIRQAFREVTSGEPRPAHLDLEGIDGDVVLNAEADMEIRVEEQFTYFPSSGPEPDIKSLQEAVKLLLKAERPAIVVGGGVTSSSAQKELTELAEKLHIPVATSLRGRCSILETHPLSVGTVGSYSRACANKIISEADLVLFVGTHAGSQVTNNWRIPRPGTRIIQIDIDPAELGRNYPVEVALLGDARATLKLMLEHSQPGPARDAWLNTVQTVKKEWHAGVEPLLKSEAVPIRPERLCHELTDFLPANGVLVADTGHAALWTSIMTDITKQEQRYIPCAGSLGWGFPGALGVKCALPDRPVFCYTGDGGFWYHISELETAVRYGINLITIVNNNGALNQIAELYKDVPEADNLWKYTLVDFAKIAQTIGAFGIRVEKPGDIKNALEQAVKSGKPAVIDVVTDVNAMAPHAWIYK